MNGNIPWFCFFFLFWMQNIYSLGKGSKNNIFRWVGVCWFSCCSIFNITWILIQERKFSVSTGIEVGVWPKQVNFYLEPFPYKLPSPLCFFISCPFWSRPCLLIFPPQASLRIIFRHILLSAAKSHQFWFPLSWILSKESTYLLHCDLWRPLRSPC